MTTARTILWGSEIGAVSLPEGERFATFEYTDEFVASGIEPAPLAMPLRRGLHRFAALDTDSFHGLPGLLADSLPDRYGNALIDAWLAERGRPAGSFDAVERLCYVGRRGMGALEFQPATGPHADVSHEVHVAELAELAGEILSQRKGLVASLRGSARQRAMREILRVGTSAGGARPKALIALDPATGQIRSGQIDLEPGFEHWILKFDGVEDFSRDLGTESGYGAVEYAYSLMAAAAGIEVAQCRLLEDGPRRHFMTKRFDRGPNGDRIHMQSLAALKHLDFRQPGANSYEQALLAIRELGLGREAIDQQFRRMVFNVVARNQDDHVKNIAFLMNRSGTWSLSPAFDITYAYNPEGRWTAQHQMSINGKRDDFVMDDFVSIGRTAAMKQGEARTIVGEVSDAVASWAGLAASAGVDERHSDAISRSHRLAIGPG